MKKTPFKLHKIAIDSIIVLIFKIIAAPIAYMIPLLMVRLYGTEEMGTYSIATYIIFILAVFSRLGLDLGLMRFVAAFSVDGKIGGLRRLFWPTIILVTIISCLLAVLVYLSRYWVSIKFNAPYFIEIGGYIALSLPIYVITLILAEILRALGRVRWVVFQHNILTPLSLLIIIFSLAFWDNNPFSPIASLGIAFFVSNLLGILFLSLKLLIDINYNEVDQKRGSVKELLRYSWPLYLSSIITLSFVYFDGLILGWFTSPQKVAYYEAALKTSTLLTFPLLAINAVVPPLFAKFYQQGNLNRLETVATTTARWMYFAALPICLGSIFTASQLLGYFGKGFVESQYALQVLVLAQFISVSCGSVGVLLMMTGLQWYFTAIQVITGIFGFPLMALGASYWGITGLASAKGFCIIAMNILAAATVWRRLKIKAFALKIAWANYGAVFGTILFFVSNLYLGYFWCLNIFLAGYLIIVAKPLYQEISKLWHHEQYDVVM
ncbi:flippase [Desulfobacca acetoxidans]